MRRFAATALCLLVGMAFIGAAHSADGPIRVLFLSKSAGFEHSVIQRADGKLAHAEKIMLELGAKNDMQVVVTKDAGMITTEQLKNFDVVMFYTTLNLTEKGTDGAPVMGKDGINELYEWVKNGGAFCGMHTAADTFHDDLTYRKLSGGVFKTHGQQEKATVTVVKQHPITANLGDSLTLEDEWYMFKDVTNTFTPLLQLETKGMKQEMYNTVDPYPNTWIEEVGQGRIFNTALGHREDVWTNPKFQELLTNGIKWAAKRLN